MGLFAAIGRGMSATKKGRILLHPAAWKNLRVVIVGTVAVAEVVKEVACTVDTSCYGLTDVKVHAYAQVIGWLLFFGYNLWTEWATSTRVGWGKFDEVIAHVADDIANAPDTDSLRRTDRPVEASKLSSEAIRDINKKPNKSRTSLDEFEGN